MNFKISSEAFVDGKIDKKYGKYSGNIEQDIPQGSFPFSWEGAPEGTKSYAVVFIDYDNVVGEGIIWIHWLAANIPAEYQGLEANASRTDENIVQGKHSWALDLEIGMDEKDPLSYYYGGPAPEDRPHEYELQLFALSEKLELENGYYYNEFLKAIRGKVLGVAAIRGVYPN